MQLSWPVWAYILLRYVVPAVALVIVIYVVISIWRDGRRHRPATGFHIKQER